MEHAPLPDPVDPDITPERLDPDAVRVVMRLRAHQHEAFLVGGCVRDLLLGHHPKDFDIATSATPEQVRALFRNSRLIGRRFRLAHVYYKGGKVIEVSTFRANPTEVEEPVVAAVLSEDGVVDAGIIDPPGVAPMDPVLEAARDFEEEEEEDDEGEDGDEGEDELGAADEAGVGEAAPSPSVGQVDGGEADQANGGRAGEADGLAAPLGHALGNGEAAGLGEVVADEHGPADLLITQDNVWGTANQDARRRDFTINGLFYDPVAGRVIDHVGGVRDLQKNEIRTIGDPEVRMREDPVRILRAVRFAAKLGLEIESRTYAAMEGAVEDLPRCSAPRLLEETFRLIRTGHAARCLELLIALDALKLLLPPIDKWLKAHAPGGEKTLLSYAAALDAQVQGGETFDDSMLLASILLPLSVAEPGPDREIGRPQVAQHIEALLQDLLRTARLPRRIAERCRMILSAQRTLAGERRRRGGLATFRQHPLFEESFKVFKVWVEATGERRAALEAWEAGAAPEPAADAPGPVKRRRRRRRRGGGGGAQGPVTPAAGSATP